MLSLLFAVQLATTSAAGAAAEPVCGVRLASTKSSLSGAILFVCDGRAISLGKAERFSWSVNPRTRGVAVVLEGKGGPRAMLISPAADGAYQVEDVTRDLAKLAGRYSEAGLGGLEVDLSRFAVDGTLVLANEASRVRADRAGGGHSGAPLPMLDRARVLDATPISERAATVRGVQDERFANESLSRRQGQ